MILVALTSITFMGATYFIAAYIYQLMIKKPLILAYYTIVIIAALTKIATYTCLIIWPIKNFDHDYDSKTSSWSWLFRAQKLFGIESSLVVYLSL